MYCVRDIKSLNFHPSSCSTATDSNGQLHELPSKLASFLNQHLIQEPFGSQENAQATWEELNNLLVVLNPEDRLIETASIHELDLPSETVQLLIQYPEFLLNAPDDHCLSLLITDQSGSGVYLLFPKSTQCPLLQSLLLEGEEI